MIDQSRLGVASGNVPFSLSHGGSPVSRRLLLASLGGVAGGALLGSGNVQADEIFQVERIQLSLVDELRAGDSLSLFQRSLSTLATLESYRQANGEVREEDQGTIRRAESNLRSSLKRGAADVGQLSTLVMEQPDAFQRTLVTVIEQSPLDADLKGEASTAFRKKNLKVRQAPLQDKAASTLNGIETEFERTKRETGVPYLEKEDVKDSWLCIALHSMLTGALGSGQWSTVSSLIMRMKIVNCLQ